MKHEARDGRCGRVQNRWLREAARLHAGLNREWFPSGVEESEGNPADAAGTKRSDEGSVDRVLIEIERERPAQLDAWESDRCRSCVSAASSSRKSPSISSRLEW